MVVQIIWLLSWPLLIAISFRGITWAIKKYESDVDGSSAEDPMK